MKNTTKRVLSVLLVLITIVGLLPMVVSAAGTTIYVKPNELWLEGDARFAAYFFEGEKNVWLDCTAAKDGKYKVEVPAGYSNVIFCRMDPGTTENNWDNKWNQTLDLKVPADNKNVYHVVGWDKGNGQWAEDGVTPPPPAEEYYIRGTMNEWGTDNKMTKKSEGVYTLTMVLDAGTYELKAGDADWVKSYPAENMKITVAKKGNVTFTLDTKAGTVTVTGAEVIKDPEPKYDYYVAGSAGLCGVEWDPAKNMMTENSKTGLYEITFSNVKAGDYKFKVTTGSWETPSYGKDGNDCEVKLTAKSNVTITFNKETSEVAFTVKAVEHVCSEFTYVVTYPTATTAGSHVKTCKECGKKTTVKYTFPDVPTTLWSHDAIDFAVIKGFFTGYKSGKFGPTDSITRQDFVVVLARIAKVDLSKYAGRTKFSDVKAGDYYESAVKWASSNGIVNGYNNGKFGVGDKITREQLVTILYNYAKKMGYSTSVPSNAAAKLNAFKDAGKVTSYAKPAVIWALNKGIISGMTETTVGPQENASRGQVATILMNISKKGIMPI